MRCSGSGLSCSTQKPLEPCTDMADKHKLKPAWVIIVSDCELLRIIATPLGPNTWRRRLRIAAQRGPRRDEERSISLKPLSVTGERLVKNILVARATRDAWRKAIAAQRYSEEWFHDNEATREFFDHGDLRVVDETGRTLEVIEDGSQFSPPGSL
jgi:hypothetical protein